MPIGTRDRRFEPIRFRFSRPQWVGDWHVLNGRLIANFQFFESRFKVSRQTACLVVKLPVWSLIVPHLLGFCPPNTRLLLRHMICPKVFVVSKSQL